MELILGPIIGGVTDKKAKIWLFWNKKNTPAPQCCIFKDKECNQEIKRFPFSIISSSPHCYEGKEAVAGIAEILFPSEEKKFYFKIKAGSQYYRQTYLIRPFPRNKIDMFSFGLISCHRPLFDPKKDEKIVIPMWRYLKDKMHKHKCCFLIQAGDQVYCDYKRFNAWKLSLKEDSQEKMLWYYRQVYIKSWNFLEVQEVMQTFPQYMIWDDHEITNGWGSDIKHSKDNKCKEIFEVARKAYIEFQHSHNPDPLRKGKLYFSFNYGCAAFLFMDLRGERDIGIYDSKNENTFPLAGKQQWDDIKEWLNRKDVKESKILFVVTSVPVCHLSRNFVSLGFLKNDIRDQWSAPHNKKERRILLNLLYQWSGKEKKPVFILSGDVHVGTVAKITEAENRKRIYQITSSPITNTPAYYLDFFMAKCSSKFKFHLDKGNKKAVYGEIIRRYRKRNFAIIEVYFTQEKPKLCLYMYEEGKSKPDIVQFNKYY